MKKILVALLISFLPVSSFSRGGGGCFEGGSLISVPGGYKPIESLRRGDYVLYPDGSKLSVVSVYSLKAHEFISISACGFSVSVTASHPFKTANGTYREAGAISSGDKVIVNKDGRTLYCNVEKVKRERKTANAYNLLVYPKGEYTAGGFEVHNKGCFLPDTFILKSDGSQVLISSLKTGDRILAFEKDGKITSAEIKEIIKLEADEYFEIKTGSITLRATAEHPFYIGNGFYKTAGTLRKGDFIYTFDGSGLSQSAIISVEKRSGKVSIYNLKTSSPNTFFANFAAVHNKGGGFHSSSRYSVSSNRESLPFLMLSGFLVLIVSLLSRKDEDGELEHIFSESEIFKKSAKTARLLEFIAKTDSNFSKEYMKKITAEIFEKLQSCWSARDYGSMKALMTENLYNQHEAQLDIMRKDHEINMIEDLEILAVDIVGIRYTHNPQQRFFTALITAKAKDYYIDDRSREFLRGDDEPACFQEFWSFKFNGSSWLLDRIEQTAESDILNRDDFVEQFTDDSLSQITGAPVSAAWPAGPQMPVEALSKGVKIARMINFLGESDKMWDMSKMEIDASLAFIKIYEAWAKGDSSIISPSFIFPAMLEEIKGIIEKRKAEGIELEFRNLCIRKVDIVLVNNKREGKEDEFIVRFSAHAQKKIIKGGQVISSDPYVKPFTEYWCFGKGNDKWQLKEILPKGEGEIAVDKENGDEESGPMLLQWYYTKKRPYM